MITLTPVKPVLAGVALGAVAADATGNEFVNAIRRYVYVKNDHADETRTLTFLGQAECAFHANAAAHNQAVVVAALTEKLIGPFPAARFNVPATGKVQVTYSDEADLTVAVIDGV